VATSEVTTQQTSRDVSNNTEGFSQSGIPKRQLHMLLATLIASTGLASMDTSILVTALPTISGQFNAFEKISWVMSAYIVTSTISTPLLGKLSDLYGRRTIFQLAMGTFAFASLLCGLSQSMNQLIAARAFQGIGGGAIQALSFAIMGDVLAPRERGKYVGYFVLAFAGAALLGPLVGGVIIDNWTWPWIFFINLPLCGSLMIMLQRTLRLPFRRRQAKLDLRGAALLAVGLGALLIGLEEGKSTLFNSKTLVLVAIAAVILPLFVAQERRAAEPMIPMRLFKNRVILACAMLGACAGAVSFGASNYMSVYFQDALFVSPTRSGLRTMPLMIGIVISSTFTGRAIAARGRYKIFPMVGSVLATGGLIVMALLIFSGSRYAFFVPCLFVMGLGFGGLFTTTSIATQNACEINDMGVATATIMFFRSLGGAVMLALSGTILNKTIRADLPDRVGITADQGIALIREPLKIKALPTNVRDAVVDAISTGVGRIQIAAAISMTIAIVWAISLPELPLRNKSGLSDVMSAE
jgi:EmrB/QacA subfamily drug resistance transporter